MNKLDDIFAQFDKISTACVDNLAALVFEKEFSKGALLKFTT